MSKLIDIETIKNEIVKRRNGSVEHASKYQMDYYIGALDMLDSFAKWLNTIESLEQEPSLPAGLDEAVKESWANYEYRADNARLLYHDCYEDGFKAGAEWMAEHKTINQEEI